MLLKKFLAVAAIIFFSAPAYADEWLEFVEINCVPELNYFSLQTVAFSNATFNHDYKSIGSLLTPDDLRKNAFTCEMLPGERAHFPAYKLTARILDYVEPHIDEELGSGCIIPHFKISLEVDGIAIHEFDAFDSSACIPGSTHSITIDPFNIRDCEAPLFSLTKSHCENISLKRR